MTGAGDDRKRALSTKAQALVTQALDLLDAVGEWPEAAAHLQLALQALRKA